MKMRTYMREHLPEMVGLVVFEVFFWLFGIAFGVNRQFLTAVTVCVCLGTAAVICRNYWRKKAFYDDFLGKLSGLGEKYYITEMINTPEFQEGRILCDALYEIDKSMKERINVIETGSTEFREYLEMWVHEMKVPLSGLRLMNYNGHMDYEAMQEQVRRLNHYVEQVLFYARAGTPQKDYVMNRCSIETAVNKVLIAQKELLIRYRIKIIKQDLDKTVVTDIKWLEFMIGQIVNNSVKYRKGCDDEICFRAIEENQRIVLSIEDRGIGIAQSDIGRVFDKTFTGQNGHRTETSTGMGLYICRCLCDKMGHSIWIQSVLNEYTRVCIAFGKNEFYDGAI